MLCTNFMDVFDSRQANSKHGVNTSSSDRRSQNGKGGLGYTAVAEAASQRSFALFRRLAANAEHIFLAQTQKGMITGHGTQLQY